MTLMELMVVLAIAGLLISLVPVAGRAFSPRLRLEGAARRVDGTVQWARNAAALDNTPAQVCYDLTEQACWVEVGGEVYAFYPLPGGITFERVEVGDTEVRREVARVTVYPDGTVEPHRVMLGTAGAPSRLIAYDRLTGLPTHEINATEQP